MLSLPAGKEFVCKILRFSVNSPVFDMNYVSNSVIEEILSSVLEERFPEIESITEHQKKTLFAVINRKDLFAILPTGHGKSIIFQLPHDV